MSTIDHMDDIIAVNDTTPSQVVFDRNCRRYRAAIGTKAHSSGPQ